MLLLEITNVLIGVVSASCFLALSPRAVREDSSYLRLITLVYLIVAATNISVGYISVTYASETIQSWGSFISVVAILSTLFMIIRDSKPVFARFPYYLTFLPFISLIFFGSLEVNIAIKNLLIMIFEAGAILVGLIIFGINTYLYSISRIYLIGTLIFLINFILAFTDFYNTFNGELIEAIIACLGMILFTYALLKKPFKEHIISQ
ncbi:MAG: hypothetical protein EBR32_00190 [Bacteroidetes bacterium]|nr:hypothetical protein [Bacteroidota bacterium]